MAGILHGRQAAAAGMSGSMGEGCVGALGTPHSAGEQE